MLIPHWSFLRRISMPKKVAADKPCLLVYSRVPHVHANTNTNMHTHTMRASSRKFLERRKAPPKPNQRVERIINLVFVFVFLLFFHLFLNVLECFFFLYVILYHFFFSASGYDLLAVFCLLFLLLNLAECSVRLFTFKKFCILSILPLLSHTLL